MFNKKLAAVAVGLIGSIAAAQVHATPVALELALMADVSGSVDAADFDLQKTGYVKAFQNAAVHSAIVARPGGIAVTFVYWSDSAQQTVGWRHLTDAASANLFAAEINSATRPFSGGTGMTNALSFTSGLFANNGYEGTREVIDVSGDGSESNVCGSFDAVCVPLQNARDDFLTGPMRAINALWIDDRDFFGDDPADAINALAYGTTNVIGGVGAFQAIAQDFSTFEQKILAKIGREINPTPEPGSLLLMGAALAGVFGVRRRVKSA